MCIRDRDEVAWFNGDTVTGSNKVSPGGDFRADGVGLMAGKGVEGSTGRDVEEGGEVGGDIGWGRLGDGSGKKLA